MNPIRIAIFSALLLSTASPSWACPPDSKPEIKFSGMVKSGEPYSYVISSEYNLTFRLTPNDHGWVMTVEDKDAHDLIYPATPPYRFNSIQSFDGSYGADVVQDEIRDFQFLYALNEDQYSEIESHLEQILSPMEDGDEEQGFNEIMKFPKAQGHISIVETEITPPAANSLDRRETVKMLHFKVNMKAPKAYFFDIPQKCD